MGCGCGSNRHKESTDAKGQTTISRLKQSVKKAWDTAQPIQPTRVVKRINKKTK
jgi:hypothetical protein